MLINQARDCGGAGKETMKTLDIDFNSKVEYSV